MATSKVGVSGNKFTQTFPATTIYWHTCKWTGRLFCSPVRRLTYSPEGERLKKEFDKTVIAARRLSCRVYFRQCPETGEFFTTQDRNELRSAEGKRIRKERELMNFREYSKRPEVKAREAVRSRSDRRKASQMRFRDDNRDRIAQRAKELAAAKPKPAPPCRVYFLTCQMTGKLFTSRRAKARFSEEGRTLYSRYQAKKHYHTNKVLVEPTKKLCKECNKPFLGNRRVQYCSDKCAKDATRRITRLDNTHQRRAKKYGVEYIVFDVIKILERDKWTCQLCGVKTPKRKRGTLNADAPELDHVIPMSKGGGHIPGNVQCACRKCNGSKSNKVVGQLSLAI